MTFTSLVREWRSKNKQIKLLILGLDNSGKSTVQAQFAGENIDNISPTMGFRIKTVKVLDHEMSFWDVGGQKSLQPFWENYFGKTDGVIWVIDCTDTLSRIHESCSLLKSLLCEDRLMGVPFLVFANKQDLPNSRSDSDIIGILSLDPSISAKLRVIGSCAISGMNVKSGLEWIIAKIAGTTSDSAEES